MATENPKESPGLLRRLLPSRLSRGGRGKDGDSRPTQPKRPGRITQNRECVRLGAERLAQPVRTSDNDSMDSYRESLTSGNVTAEVHVEIDQAAQLGKPANEMPDEKRNKRFDKMLESKEVELQRIRKICWSGIPMRYRPQFWLMLMGIMPLAKARRQVSLEKRIKEYESFVHIHSENGNTCYTAEEIKSFKQIKLDLPRTQPGVKLFHHPKIEKAISRILTIFAIRHPATGYVQGMNDIVIPLLFVFIQEIVQIDEKSEVVGIALLDTISEDNWIAIEAKAFWSFCRIMESIQDHYTRDQPGIQQKMFYLRVLVDKIDGSINPILDSIGVNYHMFAYRWVNCFLTREIPLTKVLRFWDTYLAEDDKFGGGFSSFHVYVCAVLLTKLSPLITGKEIEDVILVLQDFKRFLPLSDDDIEEIIAQAFVYQSSYSLG